MCLFFGPKCACFEQLPYPVQSLQTLTITVKPRFTDTHLIARATHCYGKFALFLAKDSSYIFSSSTRLTRTLPYFYGPLGVWIDRV